MSFDQNDPFAKPGGRDQSGQPGQPPAYPGQPNQPVYGAGPQGQMPASPQYPTPGAPGYAPPGQSYQPIGENPGKTMGIVGFILSVFFCVPFLTGIAGVIVSAIGFSKSRKSGYSNGLALAGIIVGALAVVGWIIWLVVFGFVALDIYSTCQDLGPGVHFIDGVRYECS